MLTQSSIRHFLIGDIVLNAMLTFIETVLDICITSHGPILMYDNLFTLAYLILEHVLYLTNDAIDLLF